MFLINTSWTPGHKSDKLQPQWHHQRRLPLSCRYPIDWYLFGFDLFQIRVVNAFRHGMDSQQLQQATSNPNIQRVLLKQASLSGKRFSVAAGGSMLPTQPPTAPQPPAAAAAATAAASSSAVEGIPSNTGPAAVPIAGPTSNTRITIPEQSFSHTETAV